MTGVFNDQSHLKMVDTTFVTTPATISVNNTKKRNKEIEMEIDKKLYRRYIYYQRINSIKELN